MNRFGDIVGVWIHSLPWDSDDYLSEYVISGTEIEPVVTARDLNDGEEFIISNVKWEYGQLTFESFMPSTERRGINKFSLSSNGSLKSEFTFTVVESLDRKIT